MRSGARRAEINLRLSNEDSNPCQRLLALINPYLIMSLLFVLILVVCPGLLISLYPTRLYVKLSSQCLSARKQIAIKIFVETVNCGFKDGLNGTRDYRMIPGVLILLGLTYAILMSSLSLKNFNGLQPFTIGMIMILSAFLVSYLRPCKDLLTNMSLSLNLLLLGVFHPSLLSGGKTCC